MIAARLAAHPLAARPVPLRTAVGVMARAGRVGFDAADPRGREPLVDAIAAGLAGENYYAIADGRNPPYRRPIAGAVDRILLRQGVVERLLRIDNALASIGFGLWLYDGWRPVATQRGLWDFFAAELARDNPGRTAAQVEQIVATYVADPRRYDADDPATWPPHSTGGAVDLTLRDRETGALVKMAARFDETSPRSQTDWCDRTPCSNAARLGRRLLYNAMIAEGFTNYPAEFWHFDLGTRLWAAMRQADGEPRAAAFYGTAAP